MSRGYDVGELLEELERTRRECGEYQNQVHELTERVNGMTFAATMAAGTAEAALSKLLRAQPVVDAAYELVKDFDDNVGLAQLRHGSLFGRLVKAVYEHKKGAPS